MLSQNFGLNEKQLPPREGRLLFVVPTSRSTQGPSHPGKASGVSRLADWLVNLRRTTRHGVSSKPDSVLDGLGFRLVAYLIWSFCSPPPDQQDHPSFLAAVPSSDPSKGSRLQARLLTRLGCLLSDSPTPPSFCNFSSA